ncbi:hypothetical protein [Bacillus safensis]|uniref:hypothetical protein n=1 Tax=Bacillus safensis TaxID=561879 RepID=UPI00366EB78A
MSNSSKNTNNERQSLENFLYFVVFSIVIVIVPYINSSFEAFWLKILLGLLITFIAFSVIKLIVKMSKGSKRKYKLFPHYVVYAIAYIVIRTMIE